MTTEELAALNPFPGLRAFTHDDADRFFGREEQIDELVARLAGLRLVAVAGASGCGKSSLVLAGLIDELERGPAAGAGIEWRPAVLRPGNQPIQHLADALSAAFGGDTAGETSRSGVLYGRLRLGGLGLIEAIRLARLEPQVRVLVVVDQFEEIFRFSAADPDEPSAFVKLLLNAVRDENTPISVVLTLRSSALGYCANFRDLAEMVSHGQYLVPKLTRDQRKEAIVKPIEQSGFKIAPRLVQRVLNDVSDDFDDLPVMQHVMSRTWQRWAEASQGARPIDIEDYEAAGTAANALSNHADEAYESLATLRPLVEKIFRALTERDAGGAENRRPLEFERLCAVTGGDPADVAKVVERYRRPDTAFLMPSPAVPLSSNPVIDISHESLIRQWQHLRKWAKAEMDSRTALLRLLEAARRYEKDDGDLLRGRDLERTLAWRNSAEPTPAWVALCTGEDGAAGWTSAQRFLELSMEAADRARRRRRRRLWTLRGGAVLLVVIGWAVAAYGLRLQEQSMSNALASRALLEINDDPARSAHLALAAFNKDPENPHADYALRQTLATLELARTERIVEFGEQIEDARYNRDKSRLVVAGGTRVEVYDVTDDYKRLGEAFRRSAPVAEAWPIAKDWVLTRTFDGVAQIEKVDKSVSKMLSCAGEAKENPIRVLQVSSDERHIAAACRNDDILLWAMEGSDVGAPMSLNGEVDVNTWITTLDFSADSSYVVSGYSDGRVIVWKRDVPEPWIDLGWTGTLEAPSARGTAVRRVVFDTKDAGRLAATFADGSATIWNLDLPARRPARADGNTPLRLKHERAIRSARFVPSLQNSSTFMTISEKRVRFWDEDGDLGDVRPHDENVRDANVSTDGRYLVTASVDGNAGLSSTETRTTIALLRGHRDTVTRALIGPPIGDAGDEAIQVITASRDRTWRIWRLRPPQLIEAGGEFDWKLSAAFDPAGKRVAYCGYSHRAAGQCGIVGLSGERGRVLTHLRLPRIDAEHVRYVSWSANGKWILAMRERAGYQPVLWDAESGRENTPSWLRQWVWAAFNPKAHELVTFKRDGSFAVWEAAALGAASPEPKFQRKGTAAFLYKSALSPDGRWVALVVRDNNIERIELWDTSQPEGSKPRMLEDAKGKAHEGSITELQFDQDNRFLASASSDRTVRLWKVDGAAEPLDLKGHGAFVMSASFSRDGKQVATASADGMISIWNATNGNRLVSLKRHDGEPNQVQFDPQGGGGILSASDDSTVKLGRCEACTLTPGELRERVGRYAIVTREEKEKINEDTKRFKLPSFFSRWLEWSRGAVK